MTRQALPAAGGGAPVRISVVIPTYNRGHLVHKAIDSVLAQTYRDFEIVVVDDGSKDDTRQRVGRYGDAVRYVRRENGGLSRARNTGIEAARHDWIAFLDDDDEFEPEMLAVHAEGVRLHPEAVAHATNTCIVSAAGERTNLFALREMPDPGRQKLVARPIEWVVRGCFFTQAVMARRKALVDVGLYDPAMLFEDVDLFSRLALVGPWVVDSRELLRLYWRTDGEYSLSANIAKKPLESNACLTAIHERTARDPRLRADERRLVRRILSRHRFSVGQLHLARGDKREARRCFARSVTDDPGLRSGVKALFPLALGSAGLRLWQRITKPTRGLTRSDAQAPGS